jgi:hypothetical protein
MQSYKAWLKALAVLDSSLAADASNFEAAVREEASKVGQR